MTKNKSKTPLIVAIETSGRYGSVALAAGEQLLEQTSFSAPMRHSAELLPAIEKLLGQFDKKPEHIEQVYISVGPGSFTGLRIAVTFAKTLYLANSAKIAVVDTLDAIAYNVTNKSDNLGKIQKYEKLATIIDAKRGQFFVAVYQKTSRGSSELGMSGYEKILPDCLMTAEEFIEKYSNQEKPVGLSGEGLVYYKDKFTTAGTEVLDENLWWPQASNVYKLGWIKAQRGEFTEAAGLQPLYLRRPLLGRSRIQKNS